MFNKGKSIEVWYLELCIVLINYSPVQNFHISQVTFLHQQHIISKKGFFFFNKYILNWNKQNKTKTFSSLLLDIGHSNSKYIAS